MKKLSATAIACCLYAMSFPLNAAPDGNIPPDFRGKIVYEGSVEGTVTVPGEASRNFSLGGLLNQALSTKVVPIRGSYRVEVEYDNGNLRGTTQIRSNEFNGGGNFRGIVNSGTCQFTAEDGLRTSGVCTLSNFISTQDYKNPQGQRVKLRYEAIRTSFVDYVERDKQQALAAAERERVNAIQIAENKRRADAEAATIRSLKPAPAIFTSLLEAAISKDSQSWGFNRYNSGTIQNVKIRESSRSGQPLIIRGDYSYNGGEAGWVEARLIGKQISCLHYHDRSDCSPVREAPTEQKTLPRYEPQIVCRDVYDPIAPGVGGSRRVCD